MSSTGLGTGGAHFFFGDRTEVAGEGTEELKEKGCCLVGTEFQFGMALEMDGECT